MIDSESRLDVLALNSGSSSLKFGWYSVGASGVQALLSGEAESIGDEKGRFEARDSLGRTLQSKSMSKVSQREAVAQIALFLEKSGMPSPTAVGHRIVHGGPKLRRHCLIDDAVVRELEDASVFAPLHTPSALSVIRFAQEHFPKRPQAACIDTAFHAGLPDVARVLSIPKKLRAEGVHRYGFHGLSCESIVRQLRESLPERMIIAHLGSGASITAVKSGKSVDTSLGLTPSGGLIMGSRSGDLDPGILRYLLRQKKLDVEVLEDIVDRKSGLLGISDISNDMRQLREVSVSNPDAALAIEMFCYSVMKQISAMIGVLGGADLIVFTGGIGENDADVRSAICAGLSWIGVSLDETRNLIGTNRVSDSASRCEVLVFPSQEDEQIALHTYSLIAKGLS